MQDKREMILDAALSLFSNGADIKGIKVSDIAQKAGIGKGTVYEYFQSKDEIFAQAVIYFANKQKQIFLNSIGQEDFKTEFFNIMHSMNSIISINRPLFSIILLSSQTYKLNSEYEKRIIEEIQKIKAELVIQLAGFIFKGQKEGIISDKITENDVTFAFLSIACASNHYDAIEEGCIIKNYSFQAMVEFCYEKFVKLLN